MRNKLLIILLVLSFSIGAYWVKCQLGIDIIHGFAWEDDFQILKILQKREYVASPQSGILLSSSFDEWFPYISWSHFWAREPKKVKNSIVRDAGRGSKCLWVRSGSSLDWSLRHSVAFEADPGDVFAFEGYARATASAVAQMSVVTYDAQHKPVKWLFALENVRSPDWVKVSRQFTVPPGVHYIRFRLTGAGIGDAYFDDIRFMKEK